MKFDPNKTYRYEDGKWIDFEEWIRKIVRDELKKENKK